MTIFSKYKQVFYQTNYTKYNLINRALITSNNIDIHFCESLYNAKCRLRGIVSSIHVNLFIVTCDYLGFVVHYKICNVNVMVLF